MNITEIKIDANLFQEGFQQFDPNGQCFDWCLEQQVVHSNNLEMFSLFFVGGAFLFLVLYFEANNFKIIEPHKDLFVYLAKLLLILFFGTYFLIIRMRLIY